MTTTTNFNFRVDSEVKKQSEALFGQLGVNLTTALNVFLSLNIDSSYLYIFTNPKALAYNSSISLAQIITALLSIA